MGMNQSEIIAAIGSMLSGEVTYRDIAVFNLGRRYPHQPNDETQAAMAEAATLPGKETTVDELLSGA